MVQKKENKLKKKIFIKTFGCQMNEYDSNRIFDIVKNINYAKTDNLKDANCYIINTCHIREKATEKVYHDIGRVKKQFKNRKKPIVVVVGCVAQAEGDLLLQKEKYIDAVVGPQSYHKISETILKIEDEKKRLNSTEFEVVEKFDSLNHIKNSCNSVSSYLTIQEGCDKFCKFCVVPYTRGAEFSRSTTELFKECQNLVSNGAKEIILLGQNVNAYEFKKNKLSNLISDLSEIKNLKRIRYTTSHPVDFTEDLIEIYGKSTKLMPLIHLPVQSGSDRILKKMNRKHTVKFYLNLIDKLKKKKPSLKFSSDFIIAYPGETDKDFEDTLKLMDKVEYINTYSFLFSARPGTPAAKLLKIDEKVAKERLERFQKKAEEIKMNYRKTLFQKKSSVLFENSMKEKNQFFGRDQFSNSVIVSSNENLIGQIKEVMITKGNRNTLFGELDHKFKREIFAA